MPKEDERRKELTQKEIEAEKFRTFFSTSVAQVPEAMSRRDEEETPPKRGLFGGLFHREKPESETKEPAERGLELPPTGEIVLGDDAEEPQADLELVLEPEEAAAEQPVMPEPKKQTVPATPEKAPQEPAKPEAPAPEPVKPAEPEKPAAPAKPAEPVKKEKPENKATAPAPSNETKKQKLDQSAASRSAMEQREDEEMKELKAMLFGKPKAPAKSAPKQTETLPASPLIGLVFAEDKAAPEPPKTPAEPEKTPEKPPVTPQPTPRMETAAEPESGKEKTTEIPAFRFFGKADDEVKAPTRETAPGPDDSMSLPLIGLDNEGNLSEEPPVEALKAAPAAEASTAEVPVDGTPAAEAEPASEEAPATPEEVGEKLRKMGAALTLRCVLGGILAVVLLHFGLVAEGLLAPLAALDPVVAPAAFYAANLLFLAAAMAVAAPVLRDGLLGLKKDGRPSSDTMPALAACAALLEAVVALLNAQSYQTSSFTILSGIAALGLFMALLGSRVQLAAVKGGYDLAMSEPEHRGAYRVKDKDLIRMLSRSLDQKDPWILLSRPTDWDEKLVEQSFGERASERRARKTAYILLAAGVLAGLVFLLFGGGISGGAAAPYSAWARPSPPHWWQVWPPCGCSGPLRRQVLSSRAGQRWKSWAAWTPCRWTQTNSLRRTAPCWKTSASSRAAASTGPFSTRPACSTRAAPRCGDCSGRSLRTAPISSTRSRTWKCTRAWALRPGAITTASSLATGRTWSGRACPCLNWNTSRSTPRTARCRSCIWPCPAICTPCSSSTMWVGGMRPAGWRCSRKRTSACWSPARTPA